jgi:hypothetical protein
VAKHIVFKNMKKKKKLFVFGSKWKLVLKIPYDFPTFKKIVMEPKECKF